jgi:CDP-6-deoxy-D-xylo-4-hexulose-3-dehydrase
MNHPPLQDRAADAAELQRRIADLVRQYHQVAHAPRPFKGGQSPVPAAGRVFGSEELLSLVDSSLEFWLTTGRYNDQFESLLSKFLGVKFALTANSGSSANLLALACLTSPTLGERALRPGDEVITVAAGFPTTLNPSLIYGLVPVFLDIDIPTYNIDVSQLEAAITPKTRVIMIAHTLGNPFNLDEVMRVAKAHGLWVIEDCCDALGSRWQGKPVGSFGDLGTVSFYPAHQITMGEGGAIVTQQPKLKKLVESFRDWGRDCWCAPGKDNTCGKRYEWSLGELPPGYDHKYIYSHVGYNLKITDMQAAVGVAQLARLPDFVEARKSNFRRLEQGLRDLEDELILPKATAGSDPCWFGFPITLRQGNAEVRRSLLQYLDQQRIGTRLLFGGNLTKQPYMKDRPYRIVGALTNTDLAMNQTFWLGVYPGLTNEMLDFVIEKVHAFFRQRARAA